MRSEMEKLLQSTIGLDSEIAGGMFRKLRSTSMTAECDASFILRAVLYNIYQHGDTMQAQRWYDNNLCESEKTGIQACFDAMGFEDLDAEEKTSAKKLRQTQAPVLKDDELAKLQEVVSRMQADIETLKQQLEEIRNLNAAPSFWDISG